MPILLSSLIAATVLIQEPSADDRCMRARAAVNASDEQQTQSTDTGAKVIIAAASDFCPTLTELRAYQVEKRNWLLRRTFIGANVETPVVTWAQSTSCPAIVHSLEQLDRLPLGFGIGPIRQGAKPKFPYRPPQIHSITYEISSSLLLRQPDGSWAGIRLFSNEGAVASWARNLFNVTASCWHSGRPSRTD